MMEDVKSKELQAVIDLPFTVMNTSSETIGQGPSCLAGKPLINSSSKGGYGDRSC